MGYQPDLTFAQRTLKFVGKLLMIHAEFYHKLESVPAINMLIAMLENANCKPIM